jgi:16S rRNA (adenine1518-N6/adenine1519-N6)-dimethyltransferase
MKFMNFKPKKYLGQNFLKDKKVLEKIITASNLKKDDIVLEVGPGTGVLTKELAEKAKIVLAVEKDRRLADYLKEKFSSRKNVKIINGDILKIFNFQFSIFNQFSIFQFQNYKVVANIPYYITSRFLRLLLEGKQKPKLIVLLIQKEVATRICAKQGKHSLLSLSVQYYGMPKILGFVSKNAFYPEPKVASAILKIEVFEKPPHKVTDEELFFKIIKAAFSARRKQLLNSLSVGLNQSKLEMKKLLEKSQISPHVRAQDLGLNDFKSLYFFIHKRFFEKK